LPGLASISLTSFLSPLTSKTEASELVKLQIFIYFSAGFGRNMLQDVANCQFFSRRCQKVVEKFGSLLAYSYLCIVKGGTK